MVSNIVIYLSNLKSVRHQIWTPGVLDHVESRYATHKSIWVVQMTIFENRMKFSEIGVFDIADFNFNNAKWL